MYAVVEINGKQYRAEKGATLRVDRFDAEKGSSLSLDKVLLLSGDEVKIGLPYVSGAVVKTVVQEEIKGDKIIVFKYKPKKDYRRTRGHRQRYTVLKVEEILG
ncbi:MAG TPA: 50S ribosomal protein L21 [Rectinemataceae bacterium]|nr:50S ribosomal protein L21 [Rectinemataceae bacterium]